jgi:Carboxypeptidase regulatory-like domain
MLLLLILVAAVTQGHELTPAQGHGRTYRVHGSVTDAQLTGIKQAQVEFTNGEVRFTEHAAADGTFSLSLPSGNYTLNVTAKGFCPYTRDVVIMENNPNYALSFALLDCSDCPPTDIDFVEPPIELDVAPPKPVDPRTLVFRYQEENLETGKPKEFKPYVLFGRRSDLGEFVEYTGLDCPGNEKLAVLQYGGGSLKATKLTFTKKVHRMRGEGEVTVADQRGVSRGSIVEIDLLAEGPVAVIIK